uniref:Uncharacterized protein n=1 Tax=Tetradesmus obliquus TaxID=3088 RepID=A0A383VP01_TETOB|eukprot:jgi/Sobl393_1/16594/SZX66464.1
MQAVGWLAALLLRKAPAAAADVMTRLLNFPAVPLKVAVRVVQAGVDAGVRITYAQLLAAADSMVAGVEVWVQVQQQLGVQSDIPAAAAAVCCSDDKDVIILAFVVGHGADLLQLALNRSSPQAVAAALDCLPAAAAGAALLEPRVARRLLLTAAMRRHVRAVQRMVALPCMQQHVDAATLEAMLGQRLEAERVPQQLSTGAVVQLLRAAIQQHWLPKALCRLPGAAGISSEAVLQLLQAAVDKCVSSLKPLYALPAAAQLSGEAALGLLNRAVKQGFFHTARMLSSGLPPALREQFSSQQVAELIAAAVEQSCYEERANKGARLCIQGLCQLPAAAGMSREAVSQLLQATVQRNRVQVELCRLPAAAGISSEAALLLLQAAVGRGWSSTQAVCAVPAVAQLDNTAVVALLSAAVKPGNGYTVHVLADGLPRVVLEQLSSQQVEQLLAAAKELTGIDDDGKEIMTAALRKLRHLHAPALPDEVW